MTYPEYAFRTRRDTLSARLHPEDAERRVGNWRLYCRREAQREHVPRVEWVDDAVVPEPRCR